MRLENPHGQALPSLPGLTGPQWLASTSVPLRAPFLAVRDTVGRDYVNNLPRWRGWGGYEGLWMSETLLVCGGMIMLKSSKRGLLWQSDA